jgi:bifunctional N-acetylglucosamine-1-phosphate-uridyltransferase/glucosamine-1-phosphate-acetyltransferase GlmU-like protein
MLSEQPKSDEVKQVMLLLKQNEKILILLGDMPLVTARSLQALLDLVNTVISRHVIRHLLIRPVQHCLS